MSRRRKRRHARRRNPVPNPNMTDMLLLAGVVGVAGLGISVSLLAEPDRRAHPRAARRGRRANARCRVGERRRRKSRRASSFLIPKGELVPWPVVAVITAAVIP